MITEISAGGVVFDDGNILLLRKPDGECIMPKGHIDPGETPEEAATREVFEETGVGAEVTGLVGETQYQFRTPTGEVRQKVVHWLLMEARSEAKELHIEPIFAEGAFVPIDRAVEMLTFENDKEIARKAAEKHRQPDEKKA